MARKTSGEGDGFQGGAAAGAIGAGEFGSIVGGPIARRVGGANDGGLRGEDEITPVVVEAVRVGVEDLN